jgi:hypothetical protein
MLFGGKKIKCNIRYKDNKYTYELEKHKTIKDIYDLISKDLTSTKSSSLVLRLNSNKLPFYENDYDTPLISFDTDKFNELYFEMSKQYNCSECKKIINKYCLICNKYYCNNCKKKEHDGHDFVDIDPTNFRESVYLWNISVNANLSNDITTFNKLKDFIQDNSLGSKIKIWKDNVIKKLNVFEKFINEICELCNKMGSKYIQEKSEVLDKLLKDLSKTEKNIINELDIGKDNKHNNYNNHNSKYFSFDEAEILIQKLKIHHNEIKSKNNDLKELSQIGSFNSLDDEMNNISLKIEDLNKMSFKLFDSFKSFFNKNDNSNSNDNNSIISTPYPKYETSPNVLSYSINRKNRRIILNDSQYFKNQIYNIENSNYNGVMDSYSNSTKSNTNTQIIRNKRIYNSFKKGNSNKCLNNENFLYNELNLSKIKFTRNGVNNGYLFSDRFKKHKTIERKLKNNILPLINKI